MNWASVIDVNACIGCHACAEACRAEFAVPPGASRVHVKVVEQGTFPEVARAFQVNRCLQCADAPCVTICPTAALKRRSDGIVALDPDACVGCKACLAACPYDALFIHPETRTAEKCDLCAHRLDQGLEPACALACPTGAIRVGDLDVADSPIAREIAAGDLRTRRPELGTRPRLHYRGARSITLDPLAARPASLFATAEQPDPLPALPGKAVVVAGGPTRLAWDVRASLLAWTQGLAAGVYLVPAVGVALGLLPEDQALWRIVTPGIGLLYLAGVAGLVAWNVEHPRRLGLLLTRPQMSSWAARGAWLTLGLAAVLLLQLVSTLLRVPVGAYLLAPGLALGLAVPAVSGLLLRQCRGRPLWRSLRGAARGIFAAVSAGGAMLLPIAQIMSPEHALFFGSATALGTMAWLTTIVLDLILPTDSPEGKAARAELLTGTWRAFALGGLGAAALGLFAPMTGAWITPLALAGLLLYEHAFRQAGQSIPQV